MGIQLFSYFLTNLLYVWRLLCEISYPVWLLAGLDSGRGAPANSSLPPQVTIIFPLHRLSLSIYNWPVAFPTCIGLYVNQSAALHFPHLPWVSFLSFPISDWWVNPLPNLQASRWFDMICLQIIQNKKIHEHFIKVTLRSEKVSWRKALTLTWLSLLRMKPIWWVGYFSKVVGCYLFQCNGPIIPTSPLVSCASAHFSIALFSKFQNFPVNLNGLFI